jgi:hypothetical protein
MTRLYEVEGCAFGNGEDCFARREHSLAMTYLLLQVEEAPDLFAKNGRNA